MKGEGEKDDGGVISVCHVTQEQSAVILKYSLINKQFKEWIINLEISAKIR